MTKMNAQPLRPTGQPLHRCAGCRRVFQPSRSDALTCSVRCRVRVWRRSRRADAAAPVQPDAPRTPRGEPEDLHGWRRLPGGFYAPPADPRSTISIDPNELRRL